MTDITLPWNSAGYYKAKYIYINIYIFSEITAGFHIGLVTIKYKCKNRHGDHQCFSCGKTIYLITIIL